MDSIFKIGGCDVVDLSKKFATPLYVIDETAVRDRCRRYRLAFKHFYPSSSLIAYAGKAFLNLGMCRLVQSEGLSLDAASAGELMTAFKAKFSASRIHFHGNCKTREEIDMALKYRIGRFIVDNDQELSLINELSLKRRIKADVLLRLTPNIDAQTHRHIKTGHLDTKFGIPMTDPQSLKVARRASELPGIRLMGFHCHIGSQIFDLESYDEMIRSLFSWLANFRQKTEFVAREVNVGGGLGIRYLDQDKPAAIEQYAKKVSLSVIRECESLKYPYPVLVTEPGRSIVGEAGFTLYRVHYVKKASSGRTFVIVDGGLSDNPRPALYSARYKVLAGNRLGVKPSWRVTVAGKHCESDVLFEDIDLAPVKPGDLLVVFCTGAYNYSMASNYNRYPRPAVVLVNQGKSRLMVRRESLTDLILRDM